MEHSEGFEMETGPAPLFEPPKHLVIMKYAQVAGSIRDSVLIEKAQDLLVSGSFMWGYNGTVCNPVSQVAPFLEIAAQEGESVFLALVRTRTAYDPAPSVASKRSPDGMAWESIPNGIRVSGSRFALGCDSLLVSRTTINLAEYKVAVGPSSGRSLDGYLRGRNTKACAVRARGFSAGFQPLAIQAFARVTGAYYLL